MAVYDMGYDIDNYVEQVESLDNLVIESVLIEMENDLTRLISIL